MVRLGRQVQHAQATLRLALVRVEETSEAYEQAKLDHQAAAKRLMEARAALDAYLQEAR